MIKGVLFDMVGTMLDTEPISMACWRKSAAHFGITIDDELMNTFFGKNLVGIEEILRSAFGIDEEAVKIVEGRQVYYRAHLGEFGAPVKPGLIELLEYLDKANGSFILFARIFFRLSSRNSFGHDGRGFIFG